MAELKTKPTDQKAEDFLNTIEPKEKREDGLKILAVMKKITGEEPRMWGTSIVGFGMYHYKSERSSQEGDWPLIGFSPRKQNLTLYIMPGFNNIKEYLDRLGKHKVSVGCLYIKRLSDIDMSVLEEIIEKTYIEMKKLYN